MASSKTNVLLLINQFILQIQKRFKSKYLNLTMKLVLSISLLLVASVALQLSQDHQAAKPFSPHFKLSFDSAARKGIKFDSCSFTVSWNGQQVLANTPKDYNINSYTLDLEGHQGANTLTFAGAGISDSYGATISNIKLVRTIVEDVIENGAFKVGNNVGSGWKIFPNTAGWTATAGIEIGNGKLYNSKWPAGTKVTELDAYQNYNSQVY